MNNGVRIDPGAMVKGNCDPLNPYEVLFIRQLGFLVNLLDHRPMAQADATFLPFVRSYPLDHLHID